MRRWLLVAGLLLLVSALAVGPAAAITPSPSPELFNEGSGVAPVAPPSAAVAVTGEQRRQPVVRVTPKRSPAPICTTVGFDVTVENGDSEIGELTARAERRDPQQPGGGAVELRKEPTAAVDLDVQGDYPTYTVTGSAKATGTETIVVTWTETPSGAPVSTTEGTAEQVWGPDDSASGVPAVALTQPSTSSPVGELLDLQVEVTNGSRCGALTFLVNGTEQAARRIDDAHYTARYTRQESGQDRIEAIWNQNLPDVPAVSAAVEHLWTPVVRIDQSSESSPRNTTTTISVSVTGGAPDGALAITVAGANPRTLSPVRVENTFAAEYTGTEMGRDTITATWTQPRAPTDTTATAVHSWGEAQPLDLVVDSAVADLGATVTLTAHFTPPQVPDEPGVVRAQAPPPRVKFLVAGANPQEQIAELVGNVAEWKYSGLATRLPTDTVQAFLLVGEESSTASNIVTVTWRTPTVTLAHDAASAVVGQEHVVTATVAGAVPGTVTFAVEGANAAAEQVQSGTHPTYTLRYRGTVDGRDTVTARFALGDAVFTGTALTVDWAQVKVVLDQATAVSQVDRDLVLTASLSPPQLRGAVVFTATGAGDPLTLRDDNADGGFTATLRRSAVGVDTITATWEDAGARVTSDPVRHEWRPEPQPSLIVAPGGTAGCAGSPFDLTVTARSADAPVADLPVQLAVTRNGVSVRGFTGVTDATGVLSLRDAGGTPGADTYTATATIAGAPVISAPATHTWEDCALDVAVDPGGPTSTVGSPVSPVVTVRDAAGRPVPNAAVTLRITMTGQGDVTADLVTDANGLATTEYRRDVPGTDRLTAVVTAGERRATATAERVWQLGDLQVSVGPAGTSSVAASPFTVTVLVTAAGRPVAGADVGLFVIMSGQDTLGGAPGRTTADGTFSYTYTRPVAGDDTVDVLVLAGSQVARASTRHHWTSAPALRLALEPGGTAGDVGTDFTATATVTVDGRPVTAVDVAFVAGPPNRPGRPRTVRTDGAGRAAFTYRATEAGTHTITAKVTVSGFPEGSASINRVWRAAGIVRPADPPPDLQITRRSPTTTTPPAPGPTPTPTPTPQPGPQAPEVVAGTRCPPDSTVTLTVGGVALGTVTADAEGNFAVPVRVPDLAPGRYQLVASCPPVRVERNFDVVRRTSSTGTSAASASTAAAVLSFFVLLGGQLVRLRSGS
jgi:hypothetical protein